MDNDYSVEFGIILHAGNSKTYAFEAIHEAKKGNIEKAFELKQKSEEELVLAHSIEKDLLVKEANGEHVEINFMMVHAQDHLNAAILLCDQVDDFISLYQKIAELERR